MLLKLINLFFYLSPQIHKQKYISKSYKFKKVFVNKADNKQSAIKTEILVSTQMQTFSVTTSNQCTLCDSY